MGLVKSWLPVVVWAALILSAANDQFSDEKTGGWLESSFGRVPPEVNALIRKSAHMGEYAVLALLAWRARKTWVTPLAICVAVATADETLQAMTLTRTGSAADVLLDMSGALLGLIVWPGSRRHLLNRAQRTDPGPM
jgi:VanZ family protein